jgi:hypothetical protein
MFGRMFKCCGVAVAQGRVSPSSRTTEKAETEVTPYISADRGRSFGRPHDFLNTYQIARAYGNTVVSS